MSIGVQLPVPVATALKDLGYSLSAGVEADAFAYLADFKIDANDSSKSTDYCPVAIDIDYTLAVGAGAGATMAANEHTWGPDATTTVPIWYTSITSTCAETKTLTPSSSTLTTTAAPQVVPRFDFLGSAVQDPFNPSEPSSTTPAMTSTSVIQVMTCLENGLVHCPVSSQSTIYVTCTDPPVWSPSVPATATSFGPNKQRIFSTQGAPTSYVPPPPPPPPPSYLYSRKV
ncbi:hypothetical protein N7470_008282 [Penicillium chermesinum]|nr:hypothetical protein N7470_008282 [Penicillium chermesinum]